MTEFLVTSPQVSPAGDPWAGQEQGVPSPRPPWTPPGAPRASAPRHPPPFWPVLPVPGPPPHWTAPIDTTLARHWCPGHPASRRPCRVAGPCWRRCCPGPPGGSALRGRPQRCPSPSGPVPPLCPPSAEAPVSWAPACSPGRIACALRGFKHHPCAGVSRMYVSRISSFSWARIPLTYPPVVARMPTWSASTSREGPSMPHIPPRPPPAQGRSGRASRGHHGVLCLPHPEPHLPSGWRRLQPRPEWGPFCPGCPPVPPSRWACDSYIAACRWPGRVARLLNTQLHDMIRIK